MPELSKILQRVKRVDINSLLNESVKQIESWVIELNTRKQLFEKGVNPSNVKLKPRYSLPYKRRKKRLGLPTEKVTLYLTGDYHTTFFIEYFQDNFRITANKSVNGHDLTEILEDRYGDFFGLTEENKEQLRRRLLPILQKMLRDAI